MAWTFFASGAAKASMTSRRSGLKSNNLRLSSLRSTNLISLRKYLDLYRGTEAAHS